MGNLAKSATGVLTIMLLSKGLGFLREILLAYQFGTSYIVDVYASSIALTSVIFTLFASGFSNSYVTVYARVQGEQAQKTFFNRAVTVLTLIATLLAVLCFLFRTEVAIFLAPGFDAVASELLAQFVGIIVVALPVMTIFNLLAAQLQTKESFVATAFCDYIVLNIVVIVAILLASPQNPYRLVYGDVCSWVLATLLLGFYSWKQYGVRYRPDISVKNPNFLMLCQLAIPLGASRLISELNGVSDRIFASLLGEGVTSALSYANRVQLIFYTLTTSVFLSVCYPRMNRYFAERDREMGMYYVRKAMMLAAYISIPATCGLFLFARPVTTLLFERGSFTAQSTAMTAGCLAFYALGIPFYALRETAAKALGANMEQRKILKNTAISVVFNILLNLALYRPLGHIGLALATSLTGLLVSVLALLDLWKMGLYMFQRDQIRDFIKIILVAAVSVSISVFIYRWLFPGLGNTVALLCAGGGAVVVYGVGSVVTKMDIFLWFYARLPKTLQKIPWLNI